MNQQAAIVVRDRLQRILELFDDEEIEAAIRLLKAEERTRLAAAVEQTGEAG